MAIRISISWIDIRILEIFSRRKPKNHISSQKKREFSYLSRNSISVPPRHIVIVCAFSCVESLRPHGKPPSPWKASVPVESPRPRGNAPSPIKTLETFPIITSRKTTKTIGNVSEVILQKTPIIVVKMTKNTYAQL